jgi:hypothetical protein
MGYLTGQDTNLQIRGGGEAGFGLQAGKASRSVLWFSDRLRRMRPNLGATALLVVICGCSNKPPDELSRNGYSDSAVVTLHEADNYTIRQNNVEIRAVCRYTTYNAKGQEKAEADRCLKALPVGKAIKIKRGEGDWLFADWEEGNAEWHMGLNVEKEELKR